MLLLIPGHLPARLDLLPPHAKGWQRFEVTASSCCFTGAALLIGAWPRSRDPPQPLVCLRGTAIAAETKHSPSSDPAADLRRDKPAVGDARFLAPIWRVS